MPALNFRRQFVAHIRSKRKRHTIRAKRKRPIKPGETLYLYTGMRTKACEKIIPPVLCAKIEEINITTEEAGLDIRISIFVEGIELSYDEKEALARKDGFSNLAEMYAFWRGRLPFKGDIIHWKDK